jgi:hypothetical protein
VSRDYPFQENENHEFGSPGDERSRLSMVETPKQSWTVRFKEATCHNITRFRKMKNHEFRSPGDERSGLSMVETPKQSWTI